MTDITTRLRSIYVSEGANYVQEAADLIECLRAERKALVNDVHSCGPTCVRAGCVNVRLREALKVATDWLVEDRCPLGWTAERLRAALGETK
jgi:hypothetical protein